MSDTTEIAARYGVPTPEELAAEYGKRGLGWMQGMLAHVNPLACPVACCCAVGMLALRSIPYITLEELTGMDTDDVIDALDSQGNYLHEGFVWGIQVDNDGAPIRKHEQDDGDDDPFGDGWHYGAAVRRLMRGDA